MGMTFQHQSGRAIRAFTIVEMLVVISLISLLITLLLPALSAARDTSRTIQCGAQMSQVGLGYQSYMADNNGWTTDSRAGMSSMAGGWSPTAPGSTGTRMYTNKLTFFGYVGQFSPWNWNVSQGRPLALFAFICPTEERSANMPLSYWPNLGKFHNNSISPYDQAASRNWFGVHGAGTRFGSGSSAIMSRVELFKSPERTFFLIERNGAGLHPSASDSFRVVNQNATGWASNAGSPFEALSRISGTAEYNFMHNQRTSKTVLHSDNHVSQLRDADFRTPVMSPPGTASYDFWYSFNTATGPTKRAVVQWEDVANTLNWVQVP